MVTLDLEIRSPKIEANYTIKELKDLLYLYLETLENEEVDYTPYEVKKEDLTDSEKEALNNYKTNKDTIKFYNLKA